jgi:hypothetical protein
LQPTHNKQDFYLGENKAKQYELLVAALGEKLKVWEGNREISVPFAIIQLYLPAILG